MMRLSEQRTKELGRDSLSLNESTLLDLENWEQRDAGDLLTRFQLLDVLLKQLFFAQAARDMPEREALWALLHELWKRVYQVVERRIENKHPLRVFYRFSLFRRPAPYHAPENAEKLNPRVSVVIPAFRSEKYAADALLSILEQSFQAFEILLISEPEGGAELETIVCVINDPRIRLVQNHSRLGLCESLNLGMRLARGEYIARLDTDDIALRSRLAHQVAYLDGHPEIALCGAKVYCFGNEYGPVPTYLTPEDICASLLFVYGVHHTTVMFRRELFTSQDLFYDPRCVAAEDHELWLRATARGMKFSNTAMILGLYRVHEDNSCFSIQRHHLSRIFERLMEQMKELGVLLSQEDAAMMFEHLAEPFYLPEADARLLRFRELLDGIIAANDGVKRYDVAFLRWICERQYEIAQKKVLWQKRIGQYLMSFARREGKQLVLWGMGFNGRNVKRELEAEGLPPALWFDRSRAQAGLLSEKSVTLEQIEQGADHFHVLFTPLIGQREARDWLKRAGYPDDCIGSLS